MNTNVKREVIGSSEVVPALSLVMPCYNEEGCLEFTVPPLVQTFSEAGVSLQIVLVDNGSTDRTSEVIDRLIARGLPVTKAVVAVNRGQGLGFLTGFAVCHGRYIGYICADGQVGPEDVLVTYRALQNATVPTLAKVRRLYRPDSWVRKVVSICFNAVMKVLFIGMPCLDVNGNPKIMPANILRLMELSSEDWFLEAEVMLKARHLGLPVIEINVKGQPREAGHSHVRFTTILEFMRNIISYRVMRNGPWSEWRRRVNALPAPQNFAANDKARDVAPQHLAYSLDSTDLK
jgi:glycosyltransferase involved in cell wall biosynthesis